MTIIDVVLLGVVAVSAVLGVMRGLIGVLASLAAWVLAGWAAFRYGAQAGVLLAGGATPGPTHLLGGYVLSFLAVLIVVGVVGWGVRVLVKSIGLSGIDRFLGLLLGLVRGGFIACVLVLLMGFTALPQEPDWRRSGTLPVFLPGALWLRGWLPDWAAAKVSFQPTRPPAANGGLPMPAAGMLDHLLPAAGNRAATPARLDATGDKADNSHLADTAAAEAAPPSGD